jgi:hypothetical protein
MEGVKISKRIENGEFDVVIFTNIFYVRTRYDMAISVYVVYFLIRIIQIPTRFDHK